MHSGSSLLCWKKKKKCYTVNRLLRSNEPQASEGCSRIDKEAVCHTSPHFKKGLTGTNGLQHVQKKKKCYTVNRLLRSNEPACAEEEVLHGKQAATQQRTAG